MRGLIEHTKTTSIAIKKYFLFVLSHSPFLFLFPSLSWFSSSISKGEQRKRDFFFLFRKTKDEIDFLSLLCVSMSGVENMENIICVYDDLGFEKKN